MAMTNLARGESLGVYTEAIPALDLSIVSGRVTAAVTRPSAPAILTSDRRRHSFHQFLRSKSND